MVTTLSVFLFRNEHDNNHFYTINQWVYMTLQDDFSLENRLDIKYPSFVTITHMPYVNLTTMSNPALMRFLRIASSDVFSHSLISYYSYSTDCFLPEYSLVSGNRPTFFPIFKSCDKSNFENNRPISIFSTLAKVF